MRTLVSNIINSLFIYFSTFLVAKSRVSVRSISTDVDKVEDLEK